MKFTCACCGYKTLAEGEKQCQLCNWQVSPYQSIDPDLSGSVNAMSLRQAQYRFRQQRSPQVIPYTKDRKWCAFAAPQSVSGGPGNMRLSYFDAAVVTE